jgi:hypothetical protein
MQTSAPARAASAAEYAGGLDSTRDDAGTDPEDVAMSGSGTGSKQTHGSLLDTGHFALDEQTDTIAELVADFIARNSR